MREYKEKIDRRRNADTRRQQQKDSAVTSEAADAISASPATSYTLSELLISVRDNATRKLLAGPTSSREFERTGGASND